MSDVEIPAWVARHAPAAASHLASAHSEAATAVDPTVLDLTRRRIAMLLGDGRAASEPCRPDLRAAGLTDDKIAALARWPTSPLYSAADRACLSLAEQFVIDVGGISDGLVRPVLDALGPAGLYGYVEALWVLDMTKRLDVSLGAIAIAAAEEDHDP